MSVCGLGLSLDGGDKPTLLEEALRWGGMGGQESLLNLGPAELFLC